MEFEVAVLGNDNPRASVVGEIIPCKEFLRLRGKISFRRRPSAVIPARLT